MLCALASYPGKNTELAFTIMQVHASAVAPPTRRLHPRPW